MERMRQIIAEHMVRSKAPSAHVTSFAEVDVTNLVRFRDRQKDEFLEREGFKLTFTPFFVHAAAEALREHPVLNSSVEGTRSEEHTSELQSRGHLVCRLLLEKKKTKQRSDK